MSILSERDLAALDELVLLLDEAYRHYFKRPDSACKSSEGYIEVRLGTVFNRLESSARNAETTPAVGVYSYALGPHRMHDFDSIDQALEAVRKWHANEMNTEYDDDGEVE